MQTIAEPSGVAKRVSPVYADESEGVNLKLAMF
jgi:hypothetical protein